jgi:hypothetical protein
MRLNRTHALATAIGSAALLLISCGGGGSQTGTAPSATTPSAAAPSSALATPTGKTGNMRKIAGIPVFNVDHISGVTNPFAKPGTEVKLAQSGSVFTSGWAIDGPAKVPAGGVEIVIDGAAYETDYGVKREEIAKFFKNPACEPSGFKFNMPVIALAAPGTHHLTFRVIARDQSGYVESPAVMLTVTP